MSRTDKILRKITENNRVAGAYLFVGSPDSDKTTAAKYFIDLLQCAPVDRFSLVPSGAGGASGGSIKIEQVRQLQSSLRYGPSAGKYLAALVEQADTLTDQAAAAFLKTLEEPPVGVVFILLIERLEKVLPTIRSRCQKIVFAEKNTAWQKDPALEKFYNALSTGGSLKIPERLALAEALYREKEDLEGILYSLAAFARYTLKNGAFARLIMNTIRYLQRRANPRLALEVMCLNLGRV